MATSTMKDVSKIAGVSTATVSHVINGSRFVSEPIKEKVLQAMKQLSYKPNSIARSLRSQKTNTVGVLIPSIKSFFYNSVVDGIEETLRNSGYHIILSNSHDNINHEKEAIENYKSLQVDGLIMCPTVGEHSYLNQELNLFSPVVFIDRKPQGYNGDCVVIDHVKSTYDVISLFIKRGHTRIGMVTGFKEITTTKDRIKGYKLAFDDNNLSFDEKLLSSGSFDSKAGYAETKALYENQNITALFFADDPMAIGALLYFKENNIIIPEKISIVSCNDYEWTKISKPALTIVKKPSYDLGKVAAEILLERIEEKSNAILNIKYCEIRLQTEIIERESVKDLNESC